MEWNRNIHCDLSLQPWKRMVSWLLLFGIRLKAEFSLETENFQISSLRLRHWISDPHPRQRSCNASVKANFSNLEAQLIQAQNYHWGQGLRNLLNAFCFLIHFFSLVACCALQKAAFGPWYHLPSFKELSQTLSCAFSALGFNSRPNSKDFPSKTKVFVTNMTKSIDGTSAPLFLERQILFLILLRQIHRTTEVIFQPFFFY